MHNDVCCSTFMTFTKSLEYNLKQIDPLCQPSERSYASAKWRFRRHFTLEKREVVNWKVETISLVIYTDITTKCRSYNHVLCFQTYFSSVFELQWATSRVSHGYPSVEPELIRDFCLYSCCSVLIFLCWCLVNCCLSFGLFLCLQWHCQFVFDL